MKRNGFTLIELLAVMVILAVIAIIALPIITNIINKAKKESFQRTVENILYSTQLWIEMNLLNEENEETSFVCSDNQCINGEYVLQLNGDVPNGNVLVNENVYAQFKSKDNKYTGLIIDNKIKIIDNKNQTIDFNGNLLTMSNGILTGIIALDNRTLTISGNEIIIRGNTSEECFVFDESTKTINGYNCYEGNNAICNGSSPCPIVTDLVIPNRINNIPVNKIGNSSFRSKKLTNITLPNTLVSIGTHAFSNNPLLKNILLPNSINEFGQYIFYSNHIETVNIPLNLTKIGPFSLAAAGLIKLVIPNSVTRIETNAVRDNKLTELIIPNSVEFIGGLAFYNNEISKLTLPKEKIIISFSFNNNQLPEENAYIYARNQNGIDYSTIVSYGGKAETVNIPLEKGGIELTNIGLHAFSYSEHSKTFIIPSTVGLINQFAFYGMKNITIVNKTNTSKDWHFVTGVGTSSTCSFKTGMCETITITDIE